MKYYRFLSMTCCAFVMFTHVVSVEAKAEVEEKVEEAEKEAPKSKYRNPFSSLQSQRTKAELNKSKQIMKATPKAGVKTKRNPNDAKAVVAYSKKIAELNEKIFQKYIKYVKPIGKKINTYNAEIKELNDRLKMIDNTEKTMSRIAKLQEDVEELKQEVRDKYLAFEPVPQKFEKDKSLNKIYKWLIDLGSEGSEESK